MIQGRETQAEHVIITDERRYKLKLEMLDGWNLQSSILKKNHTQKELESIRITVPLNKH